MIGDFLRDLFSLNSVNEFDDETKTMIRDICRGDLGKCIKRESYELYSEIDIDEEYLYEDGEITLMYKAKGYPSKYESTFKTSYSIYFQGNEIKPTCKKSGQLWRQKLQSAYNKHLQFCIAQAEARENKLAQEERKRKFRRFFELVYPNGYEDSNIRIDNLQVRTNSYYSSIEGDTVYERFYWVELA